MIMNEAKAGTTVDPAAERAEKVRLLAFYLPQYHPIPENDRWWGKGFTEWNNVAKARPLFRGHYQPQLPAELGFYDLRLPETRIAQAELAREHGVHGFCYYHYWFNGKQLLERPLNEVVASGQPDFPFCVCWANENWTRRWDGQEREVLIAQHYGDDDDRQHIRVLCAIFIDRRYIRIDGRPVFLVYNASALPDPLRSTTIWREEARRHGVGELYLCKVESVLDRREPPSQLGFDAAVEFQPDAAVLIPRNRRRLWYLRQLLRIRHGMLRLDYRAVAERMMRRPAAPYTRFPCVTPAWDNTARRKNGMLTLHGSTPEHYARWLAAAIDRFQPPSPEENLVFVNAWNEWAEGNHLEPCQRWGRSYLEATRRVMAHVQVPR